MYCSEETTTFTNCVIAGNFATYYGSGFWLYESETALFNSIVALNRGDSEAVGRESVIQARYALSSYSEWNGGSSNYVFNPAKPLFTDAASGDYALAANSQALNKGNNAYISGWATDLAGEPRVFGSRVDLVPYERETNASAAVYEPLYSVMLSATVTDEVDAVLSAKRFDASFDEVASTSVLIDEAFATDCGADVWSDIEAALVADAASRRKERRSLFESLDESERFDVWSADELDAEDGRFFVR